MFQTSEFSLQRQSHFLSVLLMTNRKEEFSLVGFEKLLQNAQSQSYHFVTFSQKDQFKDKKRILLRHDIDNELCQCLPLAQAEAKLGIKATYFIMLRSSAYNLLSLENRQIVLELLKLGHEIALHFQEKIAASPDIMLQNIQNEVTVLENEFNTKVSAVSFHQPSPFVLEGHLLIPQLINTYNKEQMAPYHYLSDSNQEWRNNSAQQIIADSSHKDLQILLHPMWWLHPGKNIKQIWQETLRQNNKQTVQHWLHHERTLQDAKEEDFLS
ncbi:MAG: hypothetical protein H7A33_07335 [Deltaproteobacteria bacterium]|nr:hypothetical protein [Deltaproteobacteria bacterium]